MKITKKLLPRNLPLSSLYVESWRGRLSRDQWFTYLWCCVLYFFNI